MAPAPGDRVQRVIACEREDGLHITFGFAVCDGPGPDNVELAHGELVRLVVAGVGGQDEITGQVLP